MATPSLDGEECMALLRQYEALIEEGYPDSRDKKATGAGKKTALAELAKRRNIAIHVAQYRLKRARAMQANEAVSGDEPLLAEQANDTGFPAEAVSSYWVKTKEGSYHVKRNTTRDTLADIKAFFEDFEPQASIIPAPAQTDNRTLTLFPLADLHLGLLAWHRETGDDWDISIALKAYRTAMQRLAAASPASSRAVILGGGDLLHSDGYKPMTPTSGHLLDVDSRFPKMLHAAIELMVYQIDLARARHDHVTVRILPGNHDESSAIAVTYALWAWYRSDERVTVDTDESLFWWHRFGKTMLGATHGHAAKMTDMPLIMANRRPEDWAASRHRYIHGFHVHHKTKHAFEAGGVIAETHQSPAAQDAYHFGKGYLSGRSLPSITYDIEDGEISRARIPVG